jgi:hypothetical protein
MFQVQKTKLLSDVKPQSRLHSDSVVMLKNYFCFGDIFNIFIYLVVTQYRQLSQHGMRLNVDRVNMK